MRGRKLLVAVLLSTAGVAHAGDKPLYQAAPGWVKAAPTPDPKRTAESDPMIVLFDEQARIADGQVWTYFDQAQRVVSAQMLSNVGTVTLPWQPDAGDLIIHRVEIIRGGERIGAGVGELGGDRAGEHVAGAGGREPWIALGVDDRVRGRGDDRGRALQHDDGVAPAGRGLRLIDQ